MLTLIAHENCLLKVVAIELGLIALVALADSGDAIIGQFNAAIDPRTYIIDFGRDIKSKGDTTNAIPFYKLALTYSVLPFKEDLTRERATSCLTETWSNSVDERTALLEELFQFYRQRLGLRNRHTRERANDLLAQYNASGMQDKAQELVAIYVRELGNPETINERRYWSLLWTISDTYEQADKLDLAVKTKMNVIRLEEKYVECSDLWLDVARLQMVSGNYKEAEEILQKTINRLDLYKWDSDLKKCADQARLMLEQTKHRQQPSISKS